MSSLPVRRSIACSRLKKSHRMYVSTKTPSITGVWLGHNKADAKSRLSADGRMVHETRTHAKNRDDQSLKIG